MVRMLISYSLAAGILTPPALLSNQTSVPPETVKTMVPLYPLLRITPPIPRNLPTVVPPPVMMPTPPVIAPQFVTYLPEPVPSLPPPDTPPESPPPMPTVTAEIASVAVPPPPPPMETSKVESPEIVTPPTDLTVLREVATEAHITSTVPLTAYDMMSGEPLWETTESFTVQANQHQVQLDGQLHTELILTVPDDDIITVNGIDYAGGLIIRAQNNELYVINYLSGDQITAVQPAIFAPIEHPIPHAHLWYDLDGRLPELPPQLAHHGSP